MSRAAAAVAALVLAGCASTGETLVVVVPNAEGHIGGVVVNSGSPDAKLLDTAYAAAWARDGKVEPVIVSSDKVAEVFAGARDARPLPPISFTVYFKEGSDEFAARSRSVVDDMFAEIRKRPAVEITVIGHTDRVGYKADNDVLSRQRAGRVREDLVRLGVPTAIIKSAGRGEREPLVQTADEVDEPQNRRVEINVR